MKKFLCTVLGIAIMVSVCSVPAFAAVDNSKAVAKSTSVSSSIAKAAAKKVEVKKTPAKGAEVKKAPVKSTTAKSTTVKKTDKTVNSAKSDTGSKLTVKKGHSYQFKITATSHPKFVAGSNGVFKVAYKGSKGNNYFYKVTAIGKVGQATGFYLNGSRCTVGTID